MTQTCIFKTDWPSLFILSINNISQQPNRELTHQEQEHLIYLMHQIRDHWSILPTNAHAWATKTLKTWGELMLCHSPNQKTESQWYEHLHAYKHQDLDAFKPHILWMLEIYQQKSLHKHSHYALRDQINHKSLSDPLLKSSHLIPTIILTLSCMIVLMSYTVLL